MSVERPVDLDLLVDRLRATFLSCYRGLGRLHRLVQPLTHQLSCSVGPDRFDLNCRLKNIFLFYFLFLTSRFLFDFLLLRRCGWILLLTDDGQGKLLLALLLVTGQVPHSGFGLGDDALADTKRLGGVIVAERMTDGFTRVLADVSAFLIFEFAPDVGVAERPCGIPGQFQAEA